MSVQESLSEAWGGGGLLPGWGHWVPPFEGGSHCLHYLHHSLASGQRIGQVKLCPSTENCIKDLLSMAPPIRTRPSFPHSQSLSSGSFHKPLIFIYQRPDRRKTTIRKLTNLMTWITALSNSMKLWAMPCRATQDGWVMVESSDKPWSTGEGKGKPRQYSCLGNPMNSMKSTTNSSPHSPQLEQTHAATKT